MGNLLEKWKRTTGRQGHKPLFEAKCPHCGEDMELRHSIIHSDHNQMSYKCQECAWFARFLVLDEPDHLAEMATLRGSTRYTPVLEWEHNEAIRKQLEVLGYWGG